MLQKVKEFWESLDVVSGLTGTPDFDKMSPKELLEYLTVKEEVDRDTKKARTKD